MIAELKAWFNQHQNMDGIDKHDIILQKAFAIVLYHVIKADGVETEDERKRFTSFFKHDFNLDEANIHKLHKRASTFDGKFDVYLEVLKEEISDLPSVKLTLMQNINNIMQKGKFNEQEFEVFEQIRRALY